MSDNKAIEVKQEIEKIINNARPAGEFFFTDTQKAAIEIIDYLKNQNLINE